MAHKDPIDVGTIHAEFGSVMLPFGLRLDRVLVSGRNLHVERKPLLVQLSEPGKLLVHVGEESLAAFLNEKAPGGLREFTVRLDNDRIYVQASMQVIVSVRGSAICRLRIEDSRRLVVDLESVDVMGVGAKNLLQSQLDSINPVLDMNDLPIVGTIEEVQIEKGEIVVTGTVLPPN